MKKKTCHKNTLNAKKLTPKYTIADKIIIQIIYTRLMNFRWKKKIIFNELNILLSQREQILKYICKVTPLPYINKLIRTVTPMIPFYKHIHTD